MRGCRQRWKRWSLRRGRGRSRAASRALVRNLLLVCTKGDGAESPSAPNKRHPRRQRPAARRSLRRRPQRRRRLAAKRTVRAPRVASIRQTEAPDAVGAVLRGGSLSSGPSMNSRGARRTRSAARLRRALEVAGEYHMTRQLLRRHVADGAHRFRCAGAFEIARDAKSISATLPPARTGWPVYRPRTRWMSGPGGAAHGDAQDLQHLLDRSRLVPRCSAADTYLEQDTPSR